VVKGVISSYETLINLFERTQFFLQRLNQYVASPLTPEMTELLAKIMAQVLSVLALSTKEIKERRISMFICFRYSPLADDNAEKFMKRLIGKTEVEDGFQQLDMLTKEENLMTAACTLRVASDIQHDTRAIKEDTRDIKDDARDIKEDTRDIKDDTRDIKDDTRDIRDNTRSIKEDTRDIIDNTCDIKDDTRDIKDDTRNISDNLEVNKRGAPHLFKLLPLVPIFPCHIMI
jgi:methyl-accepting chemotaxis protein